MKHLLCRDVLIVATFVGGENCAQAIEALVGSRVELATSRKACLMALRRSEFGVVVVEETLAEEDPEFADALWQSLGTAIPLQFNFAISGTARLAREVKSALSRRTSEQAIARKAVTEELEQDLRTSLTGLLLQSELALQEPSVPPSLEPKLRSLVELAGSIRERLRA